MEESLDQPIGRCEQSKTALMRGPHSLLIIAAAASWISCGRLAPSRERVYTFNRDIAPLVWQRCAGCHRPGEVAPFSLIEYDEVRSRLRQIVDVTQRGAMPPWLPEPGYGAFAGERRLSTDEIGRLLRWVEQGAVEGDAADRPSRPDFQAGWQLGRPDLVVELPEPYVLAADGPDVFRNFVLPIPLASRRFVRGLEVRPSARRVVHHATMLIDPTRASRRRDAADPAPGYEGMFSEAAQNPDSFALGWTPGITPFLEPPDRAWRLERGSDLVVQLHLIPSGKPERVGLSVGFFFSDVPPSRTSVDIKLGSKTIDIPPGDASYTAEDRFVLPVDVDVLSVYPHAHYLARDMKAFATLPDGSVRWLLWIRDWDFNWQDQYRYASPLFLPRGTAVTMQFRYDNSPGNPRNPRPTPERVVHGPRSSDEMGDLWLRLLPRTLDDAASLARSFGEHELASEIAGAERKVSRDPKNATWLNALGIRYVEAGRIEEGIARLRAAIRVAPDHAEAHSNLGHALQLQGRHDEALGYFRQAARLAPGNDRIHFNLAGALQDRDDLGGAVSHYRAGLALNPDAADAHNGLGTALGSMGRLEEAARHFRLALEIQPDFADAKKNLSLLAQLSTRP
jgi:tetratricopeptide (TPR) repeat protein